MGGTNQATLPREGAVPGRAEGFSSQELPETLKPYHAKALDWMGAHGETFDKGVRVRLDDDDMEFRGWSIQDLTTCIHSEEPDAGPMQEVVRAFALLLKVRDDLGKFEERKAEGNEPAARFLPVLETDLNLFADTFDRIEKAIDATVLRGGLVSARNLSRFRDHLLTYRHRASGSLDEAMKAQKEQADTLRVERMPVGPSEPVRPAVAPRLKSHTQSTSPATARARKGKAKRKLPRPRVRAALAQERMRFPVVFFLIIVLAVTRWGILAYGHAVSNHEPVLDPAVVEELVPLKDSLAVGGVLYGTVDDDWHGFPYRDRRERFDRLQDRASQAGFLAVVLVDEAGAFEARWRRGGIPEVWTD